MTPSARPANPSFSSGPCPKRPGWSLSALNGALLGRSHRSRPGKAKLAEVLERSRAVLGLPDEYLIGIVPGSDTGAFELAMWNMLGARGVQALAWESFGKGWAADATEHLRLADCVVLDAPYGEIVNLGAVDFDRDVLFTWNGTTSGVRVPNGEWIPNDRAGLTFCDATSAAFAMPLAWEKLDIVTYSWQKALGGEAAHGVLILSPRAVERLAHFTPPRPLPKLFRLTKGGAPIFGIFRGETINTPSLLAVEDALDALRWAESVGGIDGLIGRTDANARMFGQWVEATAWIDYLPQDPGIRSTASVCLRIVDPAVAELPADRQSSIVQDLTDLLDSEAVAHDIGGYRDAPPGLRIWCGPTVETDDVATLCPWLDWAFAETKRNLSAAARFTLGRGAACQDARFAAYSPGKSPDLPRERGESLGGRQWGLGMKAHRSMTVLEVSDIERSALWYESRLGFKAGPIYGDPPAFCIVGRDGVTVALDRSRQEGRAPQNQHWAVYIYIDDANAYCADLRDKGVEIAREPEDMFYGCRDFDVRDPDGHLIAFGQDLRPSDAGPGL